MILFSLTLAILLILVNPKANAQRMIFSSNDTVRIQHIMYTTVFSRSLYYPVLVQWIDTKNRVECTNELPRKNEFGPDPLLFTYTNLDKDYVGSGFDRGHLCPAADNECDGEQVEKECFYFSNMGPQKHSTNAGDWKSAETMTRNTAIKYDSVYVWAGYYGNSGKKIGRITVPTQCWKVIYVVKTKEWLAFLFDNLTTKQVGLHAHQVEVSDITNITGFKFK